MLDPAFEAACWRSLDGVERRGKLLALCDHLGNEWLLEGEQLRHGPTDALFSFVPGGWMRMGLSPAELLELCLSRSSQSYSESSWEEELGCLRPSVPVHVSPFLLCCSPRREEPSFQFSAPFSLISEAELEWVLRDAGSSVFVGLPKDRPVTPKTRRQMVAALVSPFGLPEPWERGLQCEDGWHPNHVGQPADGLPWGHDRGVGKDIHTSWRDEDEEILAWHASYRNQTSGRRDHHAVLRLSTVASGSQPPVGDQETRSRFAAALSGGAQEKKAVVAALRFLSLFPGEDSAPVVSWVLENLPKDGKLLASCLVEVARIFTGPTIEERLTGGSPFGLARKGLAEVVDSHLDRLLPLLGHDDKKVRLAAADILSVGTAASILSTLLAHGRKETDKKVLDGLRFAMAMWLRSAGADASQVESIPLPKAPEYYPLLMRAIVANVDSELLLSAVTQATTSPIHLDWFVALLSTGSSDRDRVAIRLAELSLLIPKKEREAIHKVALDMLFPSFAGQGARPKVRETMKCWLLLPEELSPAQKAVLSILVEDGSNLGLQSQQAGAYFNARRLPQRLEGRRIILGRSQSPFAAEVTYKSLKMPLLCAWQDIAFYGEESSIADAIEPMLEPFEPIFLYELSAAIETEGPEQVHEEVAFYGYSTMLEKLIERKLPADDGRLQAYLDERVEAFLVLPDKEKDKVNVLGLQTLLRHTELVYPSDPKHLARILGRFPRKWKKMLE
jgi:hypothetical protein